MRALTELPNRALFADRLARALRIAPDRLIEVAGSDMYAVKRRKASSV